MPDSLIDYLFDPFGPFVIGALVAVVGALVVGSWAQPNRARSGDVLETLVLYFALWIQMPLIVLGWLMFSGLTRGRERAVTGNLEPLVLATLGNLFVALLASEFAEAVLRLASH